MDTAIRESLNDTIRGPVTAPGEPGYDEARAIYNAMIDKCPDAIVQCVDAGDVMTAVRFGARNGLDIAVRGGGHSGAGLCLTDGGMTIDLSAMRGVRVDPVAGTAQVAGGAQLGDLDHAAHAFGLATPSGINSTTGVGGLTLGGGHGHLTRTYGLTVDNLLSADVVLADGSFVTADENREADLFWALRGGGGNYGVVTSFTYRLHPVDNVGVGITVWPVERTPEVLRWYRDFLPQATEDLNGFFAILVVPPGPPFPEELHGRKVCGVVWCWAGEPEQIDKELAGVSDAGQPAFHFTTPMPYPQLQTMFDALLPSGLQWYWRGAFFDRITDKAIEEHARYGDAIPTGLSTMHLYPVDGAAHRVGPDDTAWSYRDALWSGVFAGIDPDPANAGAIKDWCVGYSEALQPESMGGAYVNFMMDEGQERVRSTYRHHFDRLSRIKRAYDPDNLFHANQNIEPA
ncbi:FAD-binding oxidoreductase [Streptomyces sp. NPDC048639]|uniref:FAD-binding oxidoreductase n=1 Tax=Streptomyces sp. NPDC048639 TaxID=3365581 RepID=UPI0037189DD0